MSSTKISVYINNYSINIDYNWYYSCDNYSNEKSIYYWLMKTFIVRSIFIDIYLNKDIRADELFMYRYPVQCNTFVFGLLNLYVYVMLFDVMSIICYVFNQNYNLK